MRRLRAALLLVGLLCVCAGAQAAPPAYLVVVIDKVTWHDLEAADAPALHALADHAGVGLMVTRTGGGETGGYLTLGAGSRVASPRGQAQPGAQFSPEAYAFNAEELTEGRTAREDYRAYTGWSAGRSRIVHLGLGQIMQQNLTPSYPLRLGLLGETLRKAGHHVACLGNADTVLSLHREVAAIGMDARGRVEFGDVGTDLLKDDPAAPYRHTTDPERLTRAFDEVKREADVIIVDLGETSRAAEYAALMPPGSADSLRARALARADGLLAGLLQRLSLDPAGKAWRVVVLSPSPPAPGPDRLFAALTPIIWQRPGEGRSLLTSPSTRRPGLVTNTDVAATILTDFGIAVPADTVGRPITAVTVSGDAKARLLRDLARHDTLEVARRQVFRSFSTVAAVALWLGALLLFLGGLAPRWTRVIARGFLLVVLAVPSAALLEAAVPASLPSAAVVAGVIALAMLLALVAGLAARWRRPDALLAGLAAVLLTYDLLLGQRMLQWSTLSYSAAAGARFYGIGNEYGGVLLGAALVALGALFGARRREGRAWRVATTAGLLVLAALVGWPRSGANLGMALACAVGFAVFLMYLWRERPGWAEVGLVAVAAIVVGTAAVGVDVLASRGGASHIGLLISTIRGEGWSALGDAITRKLSMNWSLMRVSTWTDTAIAAVVVLGVAAIFRPAGIRESAARWRWLTPSLLACLAGAVASLLLNDSGILAAALAFFYGAASLAYLGLGTTQARPEMAPAEEVAAAGRR